MTDLFFAYGTLLPGQRNHGLFADRVRTSRPATASGSLVHLPEGFPVLIPGPGRAQGELLEIDDLGSLWPALDELEDDVDPAGVPIYRRARVRVRAGDRSAEAWTYAANATAAEGARRRGWPVRGRWPEWLARAGAADLDASVPDVLAPHLDAVFVGFNPGVRSGAAGHHYAGRGNRFWELLHRAGITPARLAPEDDRRLLEFRLGSTNLVSRPTPGASDLSAAELRAGAARVRLKLAAHRPRFACYVGKGVYRAVRGGGDAPVAYGLQPRQIVHGVDDVCLPQPSGRATIPFADKLAAYRELARLLGRGDE